MSIICIYLDGVVIEAGMADILERVSKATEAELNTYLKEYTTHRLARFLAQADNELALALDDVYPGILQALRNPSKRKQIYTDAVKALLSVNRMAGRTGVGSGIGYGRAPSKADELYARFFERIRDEDPYTLSEFHKLLHHFRHAQSQAKEAAEGRKATPESKIQAGTIRLHLNDMYSSAVERSMEMIERLEYEAKTGSRRQPEVLVLPGGGARLFSVTGVRQALDDAGVLKGIKRVAGTSAGALIGLPIALGYDQKDLNDIVYNSRFAQFYAESTKKFKVVTKIVESTSKKPLEKYPWHEGDLLNKFSKEYFLPELAKWSGILAKQWTIWPEDRLQEELKRLEHVNAPGMKHSLKEIFELSLERFRKDQIKRGLSPSALQFEGLLGRSLYFQGALTCIRVNRSDKVFDSDSIEDFFGDIIQERLKIVLDAHFDRLNPPIKTLEDRRNITFTQLKALGEMDERYGFKEFGVAIADSYMPVTFSNIKRRFERGQEMKGVREPDPGTGDYDAGGDFKPIFVRASSQHHSYIDMPIKKAVRISMNLPLIYSPIKVGEIKRAVDGGVCSNFSHKLFSDEYETQEQVRENTIGIMTSALEDDIEREALQDLARNGSKPLTISMPGEKLSFIQKVANVANVVLHPGKALKEAAGSVMGEIASYSVRRLMRANAMPSMETLNGVAMVNTGFVNTGDFHATKEQKQGLHQAGVTAVLNLLRWDADKHLRFSMGRLISFASIEAKLRQERGLRPSIVLPKEALWDAETLTETLMGGSNRFNLATVLLGKAKLLTALPDESLMTKMPPVPEYEA